jgi:hypothetical protein
LDVDGGGGGGSAHWVPGTIVRRAARGGLGCKPAVSDLGDKAADGPCGDDEGGNDGGGGCTTQRTGSGWVMWWSSSAHAPSLHDHALPRRPCPSRGTPSATPCLRSTLVSTVTRPVRPVFSLLDIDWISCSYSTRCIQVSTELVGTGECSLSMATSSLHLC